MGGLKLQAVLFLSSSLFFFAFKESNILGKMPTWDIQICYQIGILLIKTRQMLTCGVLTLCFYIRALVTRRPFPDFSCSHAEGQDLGLVL